MKRVVPVSLLTIFLASCASKVITNLTPTTLPRNPTGQYLVEMKLDSTQQTLRHDSISPQVVVGMNNYAMRPTLRMSDRWEALVPIPPDKQSIMYHFKVDYEYNKFGSKRGQGSLTSDQYSLTIKEN
ncbi:MAG: hypothetical protein L0Y58_05775 [Verrucomicrobia subdivision 3 bacterium]|nr:hypothetical protein [Limisphaerales bacterium]